jgi:hypothetical protein
MALTPGLTYLLKSLPGCFSPPLFVYILSRLLRARGVRVSYLLLAQAYLLSSPPAIFVARHYLERWRKVRAAAKNGAALPPALKSKWPAGLGLDLMAIMQKSLQDMYPGMHRQTANGQQSR